MKLTMGLIKADIIAAKQAIAYFEENKIRDIKNIAAYHIQQAMEKLIKIQVYCKSNDYDNHKMFNHNLEKLILYAETLDIDLYVPKYVRDNSLVITDWEAGSRYDVGFSIRIDTLKKAFNEAECWYNKLYEEGIR